MSKSDQKEIGKQIEELLTMIEQNTLRRYSTLESAENAFDVVKKKLLEALHNTPLLSYLREKKKELEPLVFCKCGNKFAHAVGEKTDCVGLTCHETTMGKLKDLYLYDFLSETLEKFDK